VAAWERLKIGVGTPPILTRHGWLIIYHGVDDTAQPSPEGRKLRYSAGVMVLSKEHPRFIGYRSSQPVLTPDLPLERQGIVANVVFPTGIDRRDDLGSPDRFDVYYGMADDRIGVARLDLPGFLPPAAVADRRCTRVHYQIRDSKERFTGLFFRRVRARILVTRSLKQKGLVT
jgi:predicted GH43/DUF377 family glycosyl hydrolase